MRIRIILGCTEINQVKHSLAKLDNDRYAVGCFFIGQHVEKDAQFETLDDAFDHWVVTMPALTKHHNTRRFASV